MFRVTTAMAINEYCSSNPCTVIPSNGDPPTRYYYAIGSNRLLSKYLCLFYYSRISGLSVSEQDVAIPNSLLSRNAQGQLVIEFYIQTQQGFVALATIQQSVMV